MTMHEQGQSVVEIMVVVGLLGVLSSSLYTLIALSQTTFSDQARASQALALAQAGLEATRSVRDQSWADNIASLTNSTTYYATTSGGQWQLTTTDPGPIDGVFTRTIVLAAVGRDASDNITSSGTTDPNTRRAVSTVSWTERNKSRTVTLEMYLTNFLEVQ